MLFTWSLFHLIDISFTERDLKIRLDLSRELFTSETWPVTGPLEEISLRHFPSGTHAECRVGRGFFTGRNETGFRWKNRPRDIRTWTCTGHSCGQSVQRQVARKISKETHRPGTRVDQFSSSFSGSLSLRLYADTSRLWVPLGVFPGVQISRALQSIRKVCMGTWKCASGSSSCRGTVTWASRHWRRLNFTAVTVSSWETQSSGSSFLPVCTWHSPSSTNINNSWLQPCFKEATATTFWWPRLAISRSRKGAYSRWTLLVYPVTTNQMKANNNCPLFHVSFPSRIWNFVTFSLPSATTANAFDWLRPGR